MFENNVPPTLNPTLNLSDCFNKSKCDKSWLMFNRTQTWVFSVASATLSQVGYRAIYYVRQPYI